MPSCKIQSEPFTCLECADITREKKGQNTNFPAVLHFQLTLKCDLSTIQIFRGKKEKNIGGQEKDCEDGDDDEVNILEVTICQVDSKRGWGGSIFTFTFIYFHLALTLILFSSIKFHNNCIFIFILFFCLSL